MKTIRKFFALLLCLILVLLLASCVTEQKFSDEFYLFDEEGIVDDFSQLTWTEAFQELNNALSKQYAFGEWKGIQWQELYNEYLPKIEAAQEKNSFEDYYLAMLSYVCEIPDGHISISHDGEIDYKYTGGSFGLTVTPLDDGKVIVTWIDPDGPAAEKGLKVGDEITLWNDQPILSVIESVPTYFSGPAATDQVLRQKKLTLLVRAPVNSEVKITLSDSRSFVLKAFDDYQNSLFNCYPYFVVSVEKLSALMGMLNGNPNTASGPEGVVETKMLDGNILYVKLWGLFDLDTDNSGTPKSTVELIRKAIAYANEKECTGMVLDLRNNIGGSDEMVADILGSFYSKKTFYEYQQFTIVDDIPELYIEPESQLFTGKIIAIINTQCVSSGEGIAQGIKNLSNGETLGFYGSNGSFGITGGVVVMPGDIMISYPPGRSLDKNRIVQIDSKNGIGGVSPSIRIPMTKENALRIANGEDVELEEALRILRSN